VIAGVGLDSLVGAAANDTLRARTRDRDRLDGGAGRDSAQVDRALDVRRRIERLT
jgi:hypothetical protein